MRCSLAWLLCACAATLSARAAEPVSAVGLVHRSRVEVGATNLAQALDYATRAVQLDPAYHEAWKQQGRVHMLLHKPEAAMASLATALELNPDDPDIPGWNLHLLVDLGRYRELVELFDRMPDRKVARLDESLVARVLSEMLDDQDEEAAARLAQRWSGVAADKHDRQAAHALVQILTRDVDGAEATLAGIRRADGDSTLLVALVWDRLGLSFLSAQLTTRAVGAFQRALALRPDWLPALRDLGWAHRMDRRPEQAAATWGRGVDTSTNALEWLAWIGDAQMEMGQVAEAGASADRLLKAKPDHERAQILKLTTLALQEDQGPAEAWARDMARRPRGARNVMLGYAGAERFQRKFREAAARLEAGYRDDPADGEVVRLLVDTYFLWSAGGPKRDAVAPLERILQIAPDHAAALRDLGWVHWARGDRQLGLKFLDRAVRLHVPNRPAVMDQVYAALADAGEARKGLALWREWEPEASMLALGQRMFDQGRMMAAEPALDAAWQTHEEPALCGLLLAYARALNGWCGDLQALLPPFLATDVTRAAPVHLDILMETLAVCSVLPDAADRAAALEQRLGGRPPFTAHVTDLLQAGADQRRARRDYGHAFRLYRRVLQRDPNRLCWIRAADCAEALGRRPMGDALLDAVWAQATAPAVRDGIQGKRAERQGNAERAVEAYARSLQGEPEQPELRFAHFVDLVKLGRLDEAREQVAWFVAKHEAGDQSARTALAEMWMALGETEEALAFWTALGERYPDSPYYTIERARALYRLGRPQEALDSLAALNRRVQDARSYELQAEVLAALGRHDDVLRATDQGLAVEYTPGLLRLRAESAEVLGASTAMYESASALLAVDPGNAPMVRLVGRSLMEMQRWTDAGEYLRDAAQRNPSFLPALVPLREIAAHQRAFSEAADYARIVAGQRPWDLEAQRRYAQALADNEQLADALAHLRAFTSCDATQTVAVIAYREVTQAPYPGRNRAGQVVDHVVRLRQEGYAFLTPDQLDLNAPPASPSVLVLVTDADPQSLRIIDEALAAHGGRATYAGFTTADERSLPGRPTRAQLKELQDSGRWFIASSGPLYLQRIAVDNTGTLGNPLTQRLASPTDAGRETDEVMRERIDGILKDMAAPLAGPARALVYPKGDYGQLSLDTDTDALANLRTVAARYFTLGFAADETGFIAPRADPLRLPARFVPADWTADDLARHLQSRNPYRGLQAAYARLLPSSERTPMAAVGGFLAAGDPGDALAPRSLDRARQAQVPHADAFVTRWNDNENHDGYRLGLDVRARASDALYPSATVDFNHWNRDGDGQEEGRRYGGGGRWIIAPAYWVDAHLYYMDYEYRKLDDFWGGFLRLRMPHPWLDGEVSLEASLDEVDALPAIRAGIEQWRYSARTCSRLADDLVLHVNGTHVDREDGNTSWLFDGRLLWSPSGCPWLAIGPFARIADSEHDPERYYAPEDAEQYQVCGRVQGAYRRVGGSGSLQAGYGREKSTDWEFVWSGRVLLEVDCGRPVRPYAEVTYEDAAVYDRFQAAGGISARF